MTEEITKFNNATYVDTTCRLNGGPASKTPYVGGKKHGASTDWDENGGKEKEIYWLSDHRYAWVERDRSGRLSAASLPPSKQTTAPNNKLNSSSQALNREKSY